MAGGPDPREPRETAAADSRSEQVGTAGEEAAKLLGSLTGWVNEHIATGDEECQICPICMLIRAMRDVNPEAVRHLAIAGWSLAAAARAFLDGTVQAGPPSSTGERREGEGGPGVAADSSDEYGPGGRPRGPTRIDIFEADTVADAEGTAGAGEGV